MVTLMGKEGNTLPYEFESTRYYTESDFTKAFEDVENLDLGSKKIKQMKKLK